MTNLSTHPCLPDSPGSEAKPKTPCAFRDSEDAIQNVKRTYFPLSSIAAPIAVVITGMRR
jgi:hypothetical protein